MRYIVVGDTAILATRDIEYLGGDIDITIENVPDGANLTLIRPDGSQVHTEGVVSEKTKIPSEVFDQEGRYVVTVDWIELCDGEEREQHAAGTTLLVQNTSYGIGIIPAPLTSANEMENMWRGIVNTLDILLPYINAMRYGADVI